MTVTVSHYGVHWAPGKIAFLMQGRAGGGNAIGVREMSPFHVKTSRKWVCNHLISLTATNASAGHLTKFEELVSKNDLVRFMLPTPKGARTPPFATLLSDTQEDDLLPLTLLMKMSSPLRLPIFWANTASMSTLIAELGMTNVQPMVLAGVRVEHVAMVRDLAREAATSPRKLLVIAHKDVPLKSNVTSDHYLSQDDVDMAVLPWETLGAQVLRAYMRGEWDEYGWFTREPVPGDQRKFRTTA